MIARATPLLAFKRGELFSRASLKVTLPSEFDAAATRDGLGPKPLGDRRTTLGEKAVLLVLILSAVPLRHWTDTFEQTPAGLVKAAEESEFAAELCAFPGYWPPVLATEVLSTLCRAAADGIASYLRATAESLVFHLPPVMLAGAVNALPTDNEGTAALVALSTFRHDALTALTQP
jgi:hypothetical protein